VYCLQIRQFVVIGIDACAKEETRVSPVDYLGHVAELDKIGLVLLIARGNKAMNLQNR
jgi:hypothetical protein